MSVLSPQIQIYWKLAHGREKREEKKSLSEDYSSALDYSVLGCRLDNSTHVSLAYWHSAFRSVAVGFRHIRILKSCS